MKVIYNTCIADPWIQVAQQLKTSLNLEPVYWIGYEYDNSEELVQAAFPSIVYHKYFDAWKGIFPKNKEEIIQFTPLNIDFLKEYSSYELQAIKIMDRMDSGRHNFSFAERQRLFRNQVRYWTSVICSLKPDLVISASVPHRTYDYVLYLLCQWNKIPFISFRPTAFLGRIMPITNIQTIGDKLNQDYTDILKNEVKESDLLKGLPDDILETFNKVNEDYNIAEPQYMKRHVTSNDKESSLFGNIQKFYRKILNNKNYFLGDRKYLLKGTPTYTKKKGSSIENSRHSLFDIARGKKRAIRYKKTLKSYYESLVTPTDYSNPFVFFALHYQPEMTTNPAGDIFVDQLLCIDILLKNLPEDYYIYVKEHKSQFYAHTEGHKSRIKEFYDDILKFDRVKLISLEEDVFKLMEKSKAVATVSGTIGWEAMVRAKPVIIFGLSWYESFDGVLKITDENSASHIERFIQSYEYSKEKLIKYLVSLEKNSIRAYFYNGLKERMQMSEEECVGNLVESIKNVLIES